MASRKGSKQRILDYFLKNLGKIVQSRDIQAASGGAVEWARRVRELRNEEGYQILSHKDRADLKPDQVHLLAQVRRATIDDQKVLLNWLLRKFNLTVTE
jgi:hypothetical protein